jgi:Ca2+/Na+ antiporter
VQPLMFTLLITSSALLGNELIATGNESEKSQKLLVLGSAFILYALIFGLMQRSASGRKPVAIA